MARLCRWRWCWWVSLLSEAQVNKTCTTKKQSKTRAHSIKNTNKADETTTTIYNDVQESIPQQSSSGPAFRSTLKSSVDRCLVPPLQLSCDSIRAPSLESSSVRVDLLSFLNYQRKINRKIRVVFMRLHACLVTIKTKCINRKTFGNTHDRLDTTHLPSL